MNLARLHNFDDLRRAARRRLPKVVFDYIDGGAEDERGLAENRNAFARIGLLPRYLVDVGTRPQGATVFGRVYDQAFGIAPTGLANLVGDGADLALARAAANANMPFVLSTAASTTIEAVCALAPRHTWFQLYVPNDPGVCDALLERAAGAGIEVLMVTVDVPLGAKRERDIRNGFTIPMRLSLANILDVARHPSWLGRLARHGPPQLAIMADYAGPRRKAQSQAAYMAAQMRDRLTWDDIERIRSRWRGRVLIKGVLAPADARIAKANGLDGVLISNHGGRQLDAAPAPIDMLAPIRDAVGGDFALFLDSGIRRGGDVVKAHALGADFVFVGRATLFGAAVAGEAGVARALAILRDEIDRCLGQIGCAGVERLGPEWIHRTPA